MKINLPKFCKIENVIFYSLSNLKLANGYKRIEFGKRGPYIEFDRKNIIFENFYIPNNEKWRLSSSVAFYIERRSKCENYIKLYEQKRNVSYANYEIGMFYISPLNLKTNIYGNCILKEEITDLKLIF